MMNSHSLRTTAMAFICSLCLFGEQCFVKLYLLLDGYPQKWVYGVN